MKTVITMILLLSGVANAEWQKMNVATTASFRGLSVVSTTVVWASGTEGTVIRTVDGGKNWSVMKVPDAETLDFRGIKAFDEKTAVIISSGPAEKGQAKIYRTVDGGKTWSKVYEDQRAGIFFDAVAFWDRKHGIVLSDPVDGRFTLFTTSDRGEHWKELQPGDLPPALPNEGAFAASNSCLTVQGQHNVWFATGGATVARVFRSRDRGKSWKVTETPLHPANASSGIFSLAFPDAENGIGVGGDYAHPNGSDLPNVTVTSDSGRTWHSPDVSGPRRVYLSSVAVRRSSQKTGGLYIWLAGPGGVYAHSGKDDHWSKQSDLDLNAVSSGLAGVWAVGPKGTVIHGK